MRRKWLRSPAVCAAVCLGFCCLASAQQPPDPQASPQTQSGDGPQVVGPPPLPGERPRTAEELRQKQIDAHDPLAKSPDEAASGGRKPDAENPQPAKPAPLPGSVAESNLPPAEGPQVVAGGDNATDQQYNGPAVLSRSYTLTRPMVPRQIRWSWTISAGESYTSGLVSSAAAPVSAGIGAPAELTTSGAYGTNATFAFHGRHLWKRDQIGVSYTGGYNRYASVESYSGANQVLNLDYTHEFSRHLQFNFVESASDLTQSGTLMNPLAEPGVSAANLNLAASATVQPLDLTTRQSATQLSLTWQKTARLSFSYSGALFGVRRTGAELYGDSGYQAQTDVNYRLTRKTTVGAYYSYVSYVFSHHLVDSNTDTAGLIYSYAFGRTTQLRTRGGVSRVQSNGLVVVPIDPAIAALIGESSAIANTYTLRYTSDISAQLVKDFGERRTANVSYAHGVSPGNGVILTSTQQVISGAFNMLFFRRYAVALTVGQSKLTATLETGSYTSDFASLNFSRTLAHNISANVAFSYRTYDMVGMAAVRPQLGISSGISWGPGDGKLW